MKKLYTLLFMLTVVLPVFPQVAVNSTGSSADASAMLDVQSTSKGILIPRLTTSQRTAISSPATGLLVYDTDLKSFYYYNGTSWKVVGDDNDWTKSGNSVYVNNDSVGIGTSTPQAPLHVNGLIWQTGTGHSVYLGEGAGEKDDFTSNNNTGIGYYALSQDTAGDFNTACGYYALNQNSNGYENTAIGAQALYQNGSGFKNTAAGVASLFSNIDGHDNVSIGYQSLNLNTTGDNNISIGSQSLYENIDGNNNVAIGFQSMKQNIQGYSNTALGYIALQLNTSGYQNTALGYGTLGHNSGGYSNTAVGCDAFSTGTGYHNSTAVGFSATITSNDMIRLGDNNVTWIGGNSAWHNTSDGRFKKNVKENIPGLDFIMKLRPVSYTLDIKSLDKYMHVPDSVYRNHPERFSKASKIVHSGFIAQEVEKAARSLNYDFDGVHKPETETDPYSIAYSQFVVPLVKAVQEQQQIIGNQSKEIKRLQSEIDFIKKQLSKQQK